MDSPENKILYPQPPDLGINVWRYLDLAKAISFLQSGELYFRRADLFQDAHEGTITKPLAEAWARIAARVKAPQIEEVMSIGRKCARKTIFINCWHANPSESEAMWQLYCPNNQGIAIQTNYTKLMKWSLDVPQSFIGAVQYLDYQTEKFAKGDYLQAFIHKRRSFAHENEVRIVHSQHEKLRDHDAQSFDELLEIEKKLSDQPIGVGFAFPTEQIIEAIFVNPYAPNWYFNMFREVVANLKPTLFDRVKKSALAESPYF